MKISSLERRLKSVCRKITEVAALDRCEGADASLRCGQWQIAFQIERVISALNGTEMLIVLRENREKYIAILDISGNMDMI